MSEAKGTVLIITEYVNAFTYNAYRYIFSNGNSYFTDRSDREPIHFTNIYTDMDVT